ncbi:MAG TPA: methyltransferase domain-containing protein [Thermodesulfobacteriota bacterium]|jgi:SAM-dependent methyltransferase
MDFINRIPKSVRPFIGRIAKIYVPTKAKHMAELHYWQTRWEQGGGVFENSFYERLMLGMAGEADASFLQDKIVADFGCGPRGSLCWAKNARLRIGIDVLSEKYTSFNIASHDMCYVCSTEKQIPLPSDYVDVLFTLNALDHVSDFEKMCCEIFRIIAKGGELIASFNLGEPPTFTEPQLLSEERIKQSLLNRFQLTSYRLAPRGPERDFYHYFFEKSNMPCTKPQLLWVRGKKSAN